MNCVTLYFYMAIFICLFLLYCYIAILLYCYSTILLYCHITLLSGYSFVTAFYIAYYHFHSIFIRFHDLIITLSSSNIRYTLCNSPKAPKAPKPNCQVAFSVGLLIAFPYALFEADLGLGLGNEPLKPQPLQALVNLTRPYEPSEVPIHPKPYVDPQTPKVVLLNTIP